MFKVEAALDKTASSFFFTVHETSEEVEECNGFISVGYFKNEVTALMVIRPDRLIPSGIANGFRNLLAVWVVDRVAGVGADAPKADIDGAG